MTIINVIVICIATKLKRMVQARMEVQDLEEDVCASSSSSLHLVPYPLKVLLYCSCHSINPCMDTFRWNQKQFACAQSFQAR